jgi:hypothetical protein
MSQQKKPGAAGETAAVVTPKQMAVAPSPVKDRRFNAAIRRKSLSKLKVIV